MIDRPTPSQAALIAYFHDGTRSTARTNQLTYAACRSKGWIVEIEKFPFHRTTDAGLRAIGLESPVHLHTGFGVDGKAVCGEQVTEQTKTATSIDKTTCARCIAEYNAYAASLTAELGKFATRQAPYDQEPTVDPKADGKVRRQLGMDRADVAAVVDHIDPADEMQTPTHAEVHDDAAAEDARAAKDCDGREYSAGARVEVAAESDPLHGRKATVEGVGGRGPGGIPVYLVGVDGLSADGITVRWADEVRVVGEEPAPAPAPAEQVTQPERAEKLPHIAVVTFHDAAIKLMAAIRSGEVDRGDIRAVGAFADGRAVLAAMQGMPADPSGPAT